MGHQSPTNKPVCENCPMAWDEAITQFLPEDFRQRVIALIKENVDPMMILVTSIFDGYHVSADIAWKTQQCLSSIWNMGSNGYDCTSHHLNTLFLQRKLWSLCLRNYMMSQTLDFLKWLWEESEHNEHQYIELLNDKWMIHYFSFLT